MKVSLFKQVEQHLQQMLKQLDPDSFITEEVRPPIDFQKLSNTLGDIKDKLDEALKLAGNKRNDNDTADCNTHSGLASGKE